MFEKILVGVDFSPPSQAVIACLPALMEVGLREVVVGHVVHVRNTPGLEELLKQDAEPLLHEVADKLRDAGLQVSSEMRMGVPAVTLAEMAEEHDVAATVVGSHGRSLLSRVLLGSVSSGLLHQTTRPVLIVRMNICESPGGITCEATCTGLFDRVLFPTDFSAGSQEAFSYLTGIIAQSHGACRLLHVQDQNRLALAMDRLEEFDRTDAERLEGLKAQLLEAGAHSVETQITLGVPTRLIVQEATAHDISCIVMSTHGRGALSEIMVGSVAMNVARLAPVPVLFIPKQE